MSAYAAELVSSVRLTKAPTPDMPADSLGGNVDLVTKSALDHLVQLAADELGEQVLVGHLGAEALATRTMLAQFLANAATHASSVGPIEQRIAALQSAQG